VLKLSIIQKSSPIGEEKFLKAKILYLRVYNNNSNVCNNNINEIQGVSKPMSQTFPGYSPPQNKQKVPINMGPKMNSFRDIDLRSCAGTLLSIT